MQEVFEKRLGSNGDSLILTVTKEAKNLGYKRGDMVSVTLGDPSPLEKKSSDFSDMIMNPNAEYFNLSCLGPNELGLDPVDSSKLPLNTQFSTQAALNVLKDVFRTSMDVIKERLDTEFAYYSDAHKSFIKKFNDRIPEDSEHYGFLHLYFFLQIVSGMLSKYGASNCPMERVAELNDNIEVCVRQLSVISSYLDDKEARKMWIENSNVAYHSDKARACQQNIWYVVLFIEYDSDSENAKPTGFYKFQAVNGISRADVEEKSYRVPTNDIENAWALKVMGPFEEDRAKDVAAYLRVQAKIENVQVDFVHLWADEHLKEIVFN